MLLKDSVFILKRKKKKRQGKKRKKSKRAKGKIKTTAYKKHI